MTGIHRVVSAVMRAAVSKGSEDDLSLITHILYRACVDAH